MSDRGIEVNFELMLNEPYGYGDITVLDRIVEAVAEKVLESSGGEIRKAVLGSIKEVAVAEGNKAAALIVSAPFQPTDQWGEAKGEPVTLRTFLANEIKRQLSIDKRDYSFSRDKTALTKAITEEVRDIVSKELSDALMEAKSKLEASLKAAAAEALAKKVQR